MSKVHISSLKPGDWIEDSEGCYEVIGVPWKPLGNWQILTIGADGYDRIFLQDDIFWIKKNGEAAQ